MRSEFQIARAAPSDPDKGGKGVGQWEGEREGERENGEKRGWFKKGKESLGRSSPTHGPREVKGDTFDTGTDTARTMMSDAQKGKAMGGAREQGQRKALAFQEGVSAGPGIKRMIE